MQTPQNSAPPTITALAAAPALAGDGTPLVVLEQVSKRYGAFRHALNDLSLRIGRGELVHVMGPSGAGKSTLLRLIAGLELPTSGRVRVAGEETSRMKPKALALLRRSMGIVLQEPLLLDDRSVLDNVMLAAFAAGATRADADSRARKALARVGIEDVTVRPQTLSAGQQQRVALARALVNRPALLLADEPGAHLDNAAAAALLLLLQQFATAGVAVVLTSHGPLPMQTANARYRPLLLDHGALRPAPPTADAARVEVKEPKEQKEPKQ